MGGMAPGGGGGSSPPGGGGPPDDKRDDEPDKEEDEEEDTDEETESVTSSSQVSAHRGQPLIWVRAPEIPSWMTSRVLPCCEHDLVSSRSGSGIH